MYGRDWCSFFLITFFKSENSEYARNDKILLLPLQLAEQSSNYILSIPDFFSSVRSNEPGRMITPLLDGKVKISKYFRTKMNVIGLIASNLKMNIETSVRKFFENIMIYFHIIRAFGPANFSSGFRSGNLTRLIYINIIKCIQNCFVSITI